MTMAFRVTSTASAKRAEWSGFAICGARELYDLTLAPEAKLVNGYPALSTPFSDGARVESIAVTGLYA